MGKVVSFRSKIEAVSSRTTKKVKSTSPFEAEPYVKMPLAVLLLDLKPASIKLYTVLLYRWFLNHALANDGVTRCSSRQLSDESRLTRSQVRTALTELEKVGLIGKLSSGTQKMAIACKDLRIEDLHLANMFHRFVKDDAATMTAEELRLVRRK